MAKIMVMQHVPYEPLGLLDPMLRAQRHRIRYVNFSRDPYIQPNLDNYDALIVLGGPMNVDELDKYPYLVTEIELIQRALASNKPVLGICLGSQLLAAALGAKVYPATVKEIGWYDLALTGSGTEDPLFQHWQPQERIFQWHGHTFDLPDQVTHLITGKNCPNQAFKYNDNAYGLQFHIEVTDDLIKRWLYVSQHQDDFDQTDPEKHKTTIIEQTQQHIERSLNLGEQVFSAFMDLLPSVDRHIILTSK